MGATILKALKSKPALVFYGAFAGVTINTVFRKLKKKKSSDGGTNSSAADAQNSESTVSEEPASQTGS